MAHAIVFILYNEEIEGTHLIRFCGRRFVGRQVTMLPFVVRVTIDLASRCGMVGLSPYSLVLVLISII
jgi:hypothetical protein